MSENFIEDTSNFITINRGDIIRLGEKKYQVTGHERERRFGMDDPKLWVKKAIDLETGEKKILKLSYFESFDTTYAGVRVKRFRNPDKEGRILGLVKDHPHFMHGIVFHDSKGNNIRVLDIVNGTNFLLTLDALTIDHETYFHKFLQSVLKNLVRAFESIRFLHAHGFNHGDIRNDHIIIDRDTGNYVWIDFDYDYESTENPFGLDLFGLGNILIYAIGKGFHPFYMIKNHPELYGDLKDRIEPGDFSILENGRFLNLRKIHPYIPVMLNDILMHFSIGAEIYYEVVDELIEDINRCIYSIF